MWSYKLLSSTFPSLSSTQIGRYGVGSVIRPLACETSNTRKIFRPLRIAVFSAIFGIQCEAGVTLSPNFSVAASNSSAMTTEVGSFSLSRSLWKVWTNNFRGSGVFHFLDYYFIRLSPWATICLQAHTIEALFTAASYYFPQLTNAHNARIFIEGQYIVEVPSRTLHFSPRLEAACSQRRCFVVPIVTRGSLSAYTSPWHSRIICFCKKIRNVVHKLASCGLTRLVEIRNNVEEVPFERRNSPFSTGRFESTTLPLPSLTLMSRNKTWWPLFA